MNRPNLNDIANKFAESQLQLGSECPLKPFDPDENDTTTRLLLLPQFLLPARLPPQRQHPLPPMILWPLLLSIAAARP